MKYKVQTKESDIILKFIINHKLLKGNSILRAMKKEDFIKICDIEVRYPCIGIGTALIEELIQYAKDNHYNKVTGWISSVDLDHIDRLKHFYGKFGFEISISDNEDDPMRKYDLKLLI